jgi:TolB protein
VVQRQVGQEVEHWIETINPLLAVGVEVACNREVAAALAAGDVEHAVSVARGCVARNPLDESRQRLLARTLTAAGDQVGALQTLEEYRKVLAGALEEEIPAELESRIQAMREELLSVELLPAVAPPAVASPPAEPGVVQPTQPVPPPRRGSRTRTAVLAAAGGGLVTMALIVLVAAPRRSPAAVDPLDVVSARLLGVIQRDNEERVVEVAIQGSSVSLTDQPTLKPTDLPAPDGRTVAVMVEAADGWNLSVRVGNDDTQLATGEAGDEFPIAWSPDSRHLVYAERRLLEDGRTDSYRLAIYDRTRNRSRPITGSSGTERPSASWSPDGTRIAYTADVRGTPDVFVVDFDGLGERNLTRHPAWDGFPAWSPDGEQLAFVSRRGGRSDLYSIRPDGTDFRRLTRTTIEKRQPLWLSPTVLAFSAGQDGSRKLQMLDAFGGQIRELPLQAGMISLLARRDAQAAWIERLTLEPARAIGSPGQHLDVRAVPHGPAGEALAADAVPVRWTVTDTGVARLDGPGRVWLMNPGRVGVVADMAGWRTDTLTLYSVPVVERSTDPLFTEDWTTGLDSIRWRVFGDPRPRVRAGSGRGGAGVFLNRGDAFFTSGAISAQAFPLSKGLTVEVDGRMLFTGKLHQEFGIALYGSDLPDSALSSSMTPALVEFRVRGPSGSGPAQAWMSTRDTRQPLPVPPNPEAWHAYALQVLEDGTVELMVNGRTYWRSSVPLPTPPGGVRVGLGFQSFETDIQHGPVRVYVPTKYYLPRLAT